MATPVRKFEAVPAVRERVPVLVGLAGPSGSGKTYSALRLATGMQSATGGDIFGIDTEARRMLHYADRFRFKHLQFDAPFGSLDYLACIRHCVKSGGKIIIVDSMSHEHESVGGMLDYHDHELDRLAGNDYEKRERVKMLAWQKPKAARRELINGILQLNANMIFCFRAKQTVKPIKNPQTGKVEIVPMGFMPIAGDEFIFEQTLCCLLLPASGGVPTWRSENLGERQMIKFAAQFQDIFTESKPLDESIGAALAQWAAGGSAPRAERGDSAGGGRSPSGQPGDPAPGPEGSGAGLSLTPERLAELDKILREAAERGSAILEIAWKAVPKHEKPAMEAAKDRVYKPRAKAVDEAAAAAAAPPDGRQDEQPGLDLDE